MSDTILRVLAVFEDIKREREKGDKRSNRQVLTDVLDRIARDRDVRSVSVLESIVRELNPDVTSVEQLERAIEGWLSGSSDLKRILNKQVRDQIDARAVADFFQAPVAQASATPSSTEASAVAAKPRSSKKAKGGAKAKAEAAARALAREAEAAARARAQEAEVAAQAATEARGRALAEAEAAAQAAAEARSRAEAQAEAAAQAAAEARARVEAAEQAEADARARAESAADESSQAAETEQSLRRVTLDEDVAAFFADEQSVNDFLRAAIAAMGRLRQPDDGDEAD